MQGNWDTELKKNRQDLYCYETYILVEGTQNKLRNGMISGYGDIKFT